MQIDARFARESLSDRVLVVGPHVRRAEEAPARPAEVAQHGVGELVAMIRLHPVAELVQGAERDPLADAAAMARGHELDQRAGR